MINDGVRATGSLEGGDEEEKQTDIFDVKAERVETKSNKARAM